MWFRVYRRGLDALFRLGFASAAPQSGLTLPETVSRRLIMQKARRQAFHLRGIALRPLVGMWFQVQCPPLVGVLPIFRSRYFFAIGRQRVFSLTGWSPWIQTHFHVLSRTQEPKHNFPLPHTGLSPSMADPP